MGVIDNFEAMLAKGQDSPLLRFSLGSAYLKNGEPDAAIVHLYRAVEMDEQYSAAWKILGKALTDSGRSDDAMMAYEKGIAVAETKGDKQAAKEMNVFLKRLRKLAGEK